MQLNSHVKVVRVSSAVAAGTTDVTCDTVDMQGFGGIRFIAGFGTITANAVTSMKVQQGALSAMTDAADLEGTSVSIDDDEDNMLLISDIYRPTERYVRAIIDRGTANAVVDFVIAELYEPLNQPVTHDATTVADSESHVSPAEGTA